MFLKFCFVSLDNFSDVSDINLLRLLSNSSIVSILSLYKNG